MKGEARFSSRLHAHLSFIPPYLRNIALLILLYLFFFIFFSYQFSVILQGSVELRTHIWLQYVPGVWYHGTSMYNTRCLICRRRGAATAALLLLMLLVVRPKYQNRRAERRHHRKAVEITRCITSGQTLLIQRSKPSDAKRNQATSWTALSAAAFRVRRIGGSQKCKMLHKNAATHMFRGG